MTGLTFVLPLLAIATACAYVCLRALRERERQERVEAHRMGVRLGAMSEEWCERHRTGDA